MARVRRLAVVALVVLGTLAIAAGIGAGADDGPTISVDVNGETVADGDRVVVPEANLSVRVNDEVDLETIVIRIDGDDYASYSPDGPSFERTLDPSLSARDNEIQVIATNANDETSSHRITVYRDTVPPKIGLSSPFTVQPGYVFPQNVTDTGANITFEGSVEDASAIAEFEAELIGGGRSLEAPLRDDGTFSTNTTIGPGNTTLRIKATDEFGNKRFVRTRLFVEDEKAPTITVENWTETTASDTVSARVRATDDVGVESITVRPEGQTEQRILDPPSTFFDRGRDLVSREVTIELRRAGTLNVTFNATDGANHSTEIEKSVEYDPITPEEAAVPDIVVHNDSSGFLDDETYTLNASVRNGSVTRVILETETIPGRSVSYYGVVFDGNATDRIAIDRNVSVDPGVTDLYIRAIDEFGAEHERTIRIDSRDDSQKLTTMSAKTTTEQTTQKPTTTEPTPTAVATVTANTEPPLEPVTDTTVPLSPATPVTALFAVTILLGLLSNRH